MTSSQPKAVLKSNLNSRSCTEFRFIISRTLVVPPVSRIRYFVEALIIGWSGLQVFFSRSWGDTPVIDTMEMSTYLSALGQHAMVDPYRRLRKQVHERNQCKFKSDIRDRIVLGICVFHIRGMIFEGRFLNSPPFQTYSRARHHIVWAQFPSRFSLSSPGKSFTRFYSKTCLS